MASGITGRVLIDSDPQSFGKWDYLMEADDVDRTSFETGGDPAIAEGQRHGTINLEGPWKESESPLELDETYTFDLETSPGVGLQVNAIVKKLHPSNDCKDGPRLEVMAKATGPMDLSIT